MLGRAWGPGAEWVLETMPGLLGPATTSGFDPTSTRPSPRAGGATRTGASGAPARDGGAGSLDPRAEGHRQAGVRPASASSCVAPRRARARARWRRCGSRAARARPPSPRSRRWEWLELRRRPGPVADPRHRLPGRRLPRAAAGVEPEEVDRRLPVAPRHRRVDERRGAPAALGDPDAVSFGDYHLANGRRLGALRHATSPTTEMAEAPRALPTAARPGRGDG